MTRAPTAAVDTSGLPPLPPDWCYESVSALGRPDEQAVLTGPFGTNLGRSDFIQRGVPVLTIGCLTEGGINLDKALYVSEEKARELERYRLREGDLLFSRMASVGRAGMVPKWLAGALFNYHIMRLRLDESRIDPRVFINYVRGGKQVRDYLEGVNHGATRDGINTEQLLGLPVAVPPLAEQVEIVAELEKQFSRLDEAVASLKRAGGNLARFAKAVLSAAVTGRLVETESAISEASGAAFESGAELLQRVLVARKQLWSGRGQYSDPSPPDTRGLGALPSGWTWASADQLSDFITKGTTPGSSKLSEGSGDVQFLKVYNLTFDGSLNRAYKPAFVSRATHEEDLARSKVRPGDVLINIVGPPLGQVSMVPAELPEANINQAIARIRPVPPLSTRYIALALMETEVMDWAVRRAKTTAGQSNLTLELCRAIPIPLPPLGEQHRIVAEVDRRLAIVREVDAEIAANLKRAQFLRNGILSRAFAATIVEDIGKSCVAPSLRATHKMANPLGEASELPD